MKPYRVSESFEIKEEKVIYQVERIEWDDGDVFWNVLHLGAVVAERACHEDEKRLKVLIEQTREPL